MRIETALSQALTVGMLTWGPLQAPAATVRLDGSSTVAPIMMAAAELFQAENPRIRVTVGISGSGGGFNKMLDPHPDIRTDINDSSRPIKPREIAEAARLGIEFIELPVALDGIAVMVHPSNRFCDHLSVEELKRIWQPGSKITNWKDVRPGFPEVPLKLYGPGTDSGTFDFFTEVVCGKDKASRSDYTASENDNTLVQGIAGDPGALGYFGYSYYEANRAKLKLLAIENDSGQRVAPSLGVIRGGSYRPLSRPLFIYVNKKAAQRPEVRALVKFFFAHARSIVEHPRVSYVALPEELYSVVLSRFESGVTGSVYADPAAAGKSLAELFGAR